MGCPGSVGRTQARVPQRVHDRHAPTCTASSLRRRRRVMHVMHVVREELGEVPHGLRLRGSLPWRGGGEGLACSVLIVPVPCIPLHSQHRKMSTSMLVHQGVVVHFSAVCEELGVFAARACQLNEWLEWRYLTTPDGYIWHTQPNLRQNKAACWLARWSPRPKVIGAWLPCVLYRFECTYNRSSGGRTKSDPGRTQRV